MKGCWRNPHNLWPAEADAELGLAAARTPQARQPVARTARQIAARVRFERQLAWLSSRQTHPGGGSQ